MKTWTPQDEENFQFELGHLQDEGHVKARISKTTIENLKRKLLEDEDLMFEEAITQFHPELWTVKHKREEEKQDIENKRIQKIDEFAPTIKVGKLQPLQNNEPRATPKQIAFLRQMGIRDEMVLATIGKRQASSLIGETIEYRNDYVTGDKMSAAGVVALIIKIGVPISVLVIIFFVLRYLANK